MTHYLTLPNKATWDAFGWLPSECGQYAYSPKGLFAVAGNGWFEDEQGNRTYKTEYWVDIPENYTVPEELEQYRVIPNNAKRVFL